MGQNLGLNPMRMVALIVLAVAGVLGGYLLGKYVKPASPPVVQNADLLPPQSLQNPPPETLQKVDDHHHYEESLPRNIIIQENGQLKRIALPEPEMTLDLGERPKLERESPEVARAADNAPASPTPDSDAKNEPELTETLPEAAQEVSSLPPSILARAMPEDLATLQANSSDSLPPWLRNAVPFDLDDTKAKIVIVMDDLGLNKRRARKTVALPGPLTLSYMAYAEDLDRQIQQARAAGHEMMLHIPMEPRSATIDPGPNVLLSGLPREELLKSINWNLDQTDKVVGINNHMGSRFTSDLEGMQTVTEVLNERGLLFLDSATSGSSVAHSAAEDAGIPFAVRNVFLDHEDDLASIKRQLRATESVAKRTGVAIAIGHPRDKTLEALSEWLPTLSERGFQLVPISAVVKIKADKS